jgi:hypothetical protein
MNLYALLFEFGSYITWGLFFCIILTRWRDHRDFLYLFLGLTLSFPYEWIADSFWLFIDYSEQFNMMFGRFPFFMPFAWAWFYAVPIIFMLLNKEKIDRMPLWLNIVWMFALFFVWDLLVEGVSVNFDLWTYYVSPKLHILPGLPYYVPIWLGIQLPTYYYGHLWARKLAETKSWGMGFLLHLLVYYALGAAVAISGWIINTKILGIEAIGQTIHYPW